MSEFYEDSFVDDELAQCDIRSFTANQEKRDRAVQMGMLSWVIWDTEPMFWALINPIFAGVRLDRRQAPVTVLSPNATDKISAFGVLLRAMSSWLWRRRFRKWLEVRRYLVWYGKNRITVQMGERGCRPPRVP